jgi:hypothetical protein
MRALENSDFLTLWERGAGLHPIDQGLLALSAAFPETPYETLADWPLGRRNTALARLRLVCFGPRLEAWLTCKRCDEKLEFQMDGTALATEHLGREYPPIDPIVVRGHSFRLPTSRDLARVAAETDARSAAIELVESCRLEEREPRDWSREDLEEVGEQMALADPMAETRLTLICPSCGTECDEALDIAAFLWTEIEGRAKRLLLEIDALARAYGWTEGEILSLSDRRRAHYLEMVHE